MAGILAGRKDRDIPQLLADFETELALVLKYIQKAKVAKDHRLNKVDSEAMKIAFGDLLSTCAGLGLVPRFTEGNPVTRLLAAPFVAVQKEVAKQMLESMQSGQLGGFGGITTEQ